MVAKPHWSKIVPNRRVTTPEQDDAIAADYPTLGVSKTARKHNVPVGAVNRLTRERGLPLIGRMTPEEDRIVEELYIHEGLTLRVTCREVGWSQGAVEAALARRGHSPRSPEEASQNRKRTVPYWTKYTMNHKAFDCAENSPTASYFLGLLLTDGWVARRGKTAEIGLSQAEEGADIIYAYKQFIESEAPVWRHARSSKSVQVQDQIGMTVTSVYMADTLATYGIIPRKTSVQVVDPRVEKNRHFWRGVLDGDGDLGAVPCPRVVLRNTSNHLMDKWSDYLRVVTGTKNKEGVTHLPSGKRQRYLGVFGAEAIVLAKEVYTDHSVSQHRKQLVMDTVMRL